MKKNVTYLVRFKWNDSDYNQVVTLAFERHSDALEMMEILHQDLEASDISLEVREDDL